MLSAHVNALNIDAPSLFQIMKSKTDDNQGQVEGMSTELTIYGYNEEPLSSVEIARRNKDAVFNSLFDMEKVRHTCESNGLKFGQRMSFLPKLKVDFEGSQHSSGRTKAIGGFESRDSQA
ncbi:hypothetical protein G6F49_013762 [Rhizopus delemar]|nr:hypothetical protein G6F49_013762 [Rhizopus delemar]